MEKRFGMLLILLGTMLVLAGCGTDRTSHITVSKERTWNPVFDLHEPQEVNIEGFLSESFGVSVGNESTCSYTVDGGALWTRAANSSRCRYCLDMVNENLMWSGGQGQDVRVSRDGGRSWEAVSDTECLTSAHSAIDFIDDKSGWVSTYQDLAATEDGGQTWQKLTIPEVEGIAAIFRRTKDHGYVLTTDAILYETKDGGKTFEGRKLDLTFCGGYNFFGETGKLNYSMTSLADITFFDESNGMIAMITRTEDRSRWVYVLTTNDGGDSWTAEEMVLPEDFVPKRLFLSEDGNFLTIGTRDRVTLLKNAKAGAPVIQNTNKQGSGDSDMKENQATPTKVPTKAPTKAPTIAPTRPPAKPLVTKDSTWSLVRDARATQSVHIEGFLNEDFGITVGYSGATYYTKDGGETWTESVNKSMCRFCLDIVNENLIVSGGNGNDVRISQDGGAVFTELPDTKGLTTVHSAIDFIDENVGWIATNDKLLWTNDAGTTWEKIKLPAELRKLAAINRRTERCGYVLGVDGTLYITKDNGTLWSTKDISLSNYGAYNPVNKKCEIKKTSVATADMAFADENNGVIAFLSVLKDESRQVWVITTTDGGETWVSEQVCYAEDFVPARLNLSKDGKILTIGGPGRMLVYKTSK